MGVMGYNQAEMQGPTANIQRTIKDKMGQDTQSLVLDFRNDQDLNSYVGWLNDYPQELRLLKAALANTYNLSYKTNTDQLTVTRKSRQ